MPMHDWTRVAAGTYHAFHHRWAGAIMDRLNAGLLPRGYFALVEQATGQYNADVVGLRRRDRTDPTGGGVGVAPPARPATEFVLSDPEAARYARRAKRVAIRHRQGDVVAVIELVSPGNKDRQHAIRAFVGKAVELVEGGVNLLVVDPFPPGPRDPHGLQALICGELTGQDFEPPAGRPLSFGSYEVEPPRTAYIEATAVGRPLPSMPLFLGPDLYVTLSLEETYQATWNVMPAEFREEFEAPGQEM